MPFSKMKKDIELVKAVSVALETEKMSIPLMRSLLTMLEKNISHTKIAPLSKCYDLKNAQGQSEIFLGYEGKVPLEVLRLVGNKLFYKRERMDKYDTYGIQMVGFELLLTKAEARGVDGKGYEKIYTTVLGELGKQMIDEFLKANGMMIRN